MHTRTFSLRSAAWLVLVTALVNIAGCFPNPPKDDEGNASFAREAIPVVLGRRAFGVDEVEVVADVSTLLGRDVAARMLMKDNAYVDHWTDTIIDIIKMQRDPDGGLAAQDSNCWGAPTRANPDPAIATWVRDHTPAAAGAPTPAWNMTDLVRSAVLIDDLSVIYRANLFTLSMRRAGSSGGTAELADSLERVYLNRDPTCLRCHNPTYSTSNKTDGSGNITWRRLWTIPGHPEKALFGNYYDAAAVSERLKPIMRGDVRKPAGGAFGIRPWGMADSCATDTATPAAANNSTVTHQGFQTLGAGAPNNPNAGFGSLNGAMNPKVSLWELEAALRQGITSLSDGYERFPASAPLLPPDQQQYCDVVAIFSSNCVGCHSGPSPSGGMDLSADPAAQIVNVNTQAGSSTLAKRVVPGNTAQSELSRRINAGAYPPRMPPGGGLAAADKTTIDAWITAGAHSISTANCNTSTIPDVNPDEALAFLTAANVVDGIWMSVNGYRLTIDHGFSRTAEQRDMLWNLTEYEFVPNHWSLKTVLTKMMGSNWFARRAPTISQLDNAYKLQPLLDPWILADPTDVSNPNPPAHQKFNGQGELVNRYRVNTVLRTVASTLAWKQPQHFPGGGYPSPLDADLGQYFSPGASGFNGVNFQSLLALESQAGLCNKTGRAVGATDWVDKLVDDINAHNAANPDAPVTLGEAWSILKDRMIQDPTIERALPSALVGVAGAKTEEQALIALLNQGIAVAGGADLNTPTSALTAPQLLGKLREGCGVLVKTPEFLLSNVTPRGYSDNNMPDPPRLTVCMPGETCGFPASCGYWRGKLSSMGHTVACQDRSVRPAVRRLRPWIDTDILIALDPGPFTPIEIIPQIDPGPRIPELRPATRLSALNAPLARSSLDLVSRTPLILIAAANTSTASTLDVVRDRVESLCPTGMCGHVQRPSLAVERCLQKPSADACRLLTPTCDPRSASGINACGRLPADVHDSGVLALWGEGATVTGAKGVRLLRGPDYKWVTLAPKTTLRTGDLLHVPLKAELQLQQGQVRFGSNALEVATVDGIKGHLIAVTGKSAERLLATPTKRGALSPARLKKEAQAGLYETRAPAKKDIDRIIKYGQKPAHAPTLTPEQMNAINKDFNGIHFSPDRGVTPDGRDIEKKQ
ncbi:MAG: hypothetical protein HY308_14260 [Gammaproteobacteria bacterium]|nr:hypothetical protein [Gammaproteobacteria bacterium]